MTRYLRDHGTDHPGETYPLRAVVAVSGALGVAGYVLISRRRERSLVRGRWAVMSGMRRRGFSLLQIGQKVGRDHTTVLHSLRTADFMRERDPMLAGLIELAEAA